MCGRFTLATAPEIVAEFLELAEVPELAARYKIAPTQSAPAVFADATSGLRRLLPLRWGLIPSWAKDPKIGARMINARAETVATKPSFRAAFRNRRCLVVADGFYEWQKLSRGKQPYYIRMSDEAPFAFAGLWERWEGPGGEVVDSCTIITTQPNDLVRPIHDRMPVILDMGDYSHWLDPNKSKVDTLTPLLRPYPSEKMLAYPVGTRVNSPAHDDATCIQPE